MLMFAVTGSLALVAVRATLLHGFGLTGVSLLAPWRPATALYVALMTPCYSASLLAVGTAMGRRPFALRMVRRMWSRFLPASWLPPLPASTAAPAAAVAAPVAAAAQTAAPAPGPGAGTGAGTGSGGVPTPGAG